jgi:hypothetical protein
MKYLAILVFFLSGCSSILMGSSINHGANLTPEQIEAYGKVGSAVYTCFQIGGPPPAGNTMVILIPKDKTMAFIFGDNCHLINR